MSDKDNRANKLYVAYGSNMNTRQMSIRCPRAEQAGIVNITGYKLAFMHHGVATIIPDKDSTIQGLAWKLTSSCEHALDQYEGAPHFYSKHNVSVEQDGTNLEMMVYIMNPEFNRPQFPPDSYYKCIEEAYMELGLDTAPLKRALNEAALGMRDLELQKRPNRGNER